MCVRAGLAPGLAPCARKPHTAQHPCFIESGGVRTWPRLYCSGSRCCCARLRSGRLVRGMVLRAVGAHSPCDGPQHVGPLGIACVHLPPALLLGPCAGSAGNVCVWHNMSCKICMQSVVVAMASAAAAAAAAAARTYTLRARFRASIAVAWSTTFLQAAPRPDHGAWLRVPEGHG